MSDAFIDAKKVTKSCILVANTPIQIYILIRHLTDIMTNESKIYLKRGRPIDSNDIVH